MVMRGLKYRYRKPVKRQPNIHARQFTVAYAMRVPVPLFIRDRIGLSSVRLYEIRGGNSVWDWWKKKSEMQAW